MTSIFIMAPQLVWLIITTTIPRPPLHHQAHFIFVELAFISTVGVSSWMA